MLHKWMKGLMPKEDQFVVLFSQQGQCLTEAAKSLHDLLNGGNIKDCAIELSKTEKKADLIAKSLYRLLNHSFATPFRRSEIRALVYALDSVIDYSEDVAKRLQIYKVTQTTPQMVQMAACINQCVVLINEALPLTGNLSKNAESINKICSAIHNIENQADEFHDLALKDLYSKEIVGGTLVLERVYDLIEEVVDACNHVANILSDIVAENA